jgi:serine/threonine-protein kinase HipA
MLAGELMAMADAVATEAEALFEEVADSGAFHPILKGVRQVIETRCNLVRRALEREAR